MPVFDSTTLARFYHEGENVFSDSTPFLVDRRALSIVANTSTYVLPDFVRSIRRVTWQGHKLDPLTRRNQRDIFQAADQQSRPFWYVFNNIGLNKISLFPIPNQVLAIPGTDLWKSAAISAGCIVEFYRVTDNINFVLPPYIKRQLLKQYTAMRAFSVDSSGINMKLVDYFTKRWNLRAEEFTGLLDELHSKPRKLVVSDIVGSNYFPASPLLPINRFGISVDVGE